MQKAARCVVGDDYPEPVANHTEQRKVCVRRLKDLCISLDIFGTYSIIVYLRCIQIFAFTETVPDVPLLDFSTCAVIRQFSGLYSPVRPAKIQSLFYCQTVL